MFTKSVSTKAPFKIDLIVWKHIHLITTSFILVVFKIDLIVWKLDQVTYNTSPIAQDFKIDLIVWKRSIGSY